MSTSALVALANALREFIAERQYRESLVERVRSLEAVGLSFSEADLSTSIVLPKADPV
jgi:hypothetical protein